MSDLSGRAVAVVGAGFAGLTAAFRLRSYGAHVTLYEARDVVGGRVRTAFVDGRVLEVGAELIGKNHPCWMKYAQLFGLGLLDVTDWDGYVAAGLRPQVRLRGATLDPALLREVEGDVHHVQHVLAYEATKSLPGDLPHHPWDAPDAGALDQRNVAEWMDEHVTAMGLAPDRDARLRAFLDIEFESHMTVPLDEQSLLASFACVAGGGGDKYWTDTEVYRCAEGNQTLATRMLDRMRIVSDLPAVTLRQPVRVTALDVADGRVTVTAEPAAGGDADNASYDYAVVAVPPAVWNGIAVGGTTDWFPGGVPGHGAAVKYLGSVAGPYWLDRRMAPSGFDDTLGQVWEGTDGQDFTTNLCLTAFAGGTFATTLRETDFPAALERLLPGFEQHATDHVYANWPREPYVMTGYSCPAPGQVTDHQRRMQLPVQDRIFLAGEACSPAFFGYMEGALQSGEAAADRIVTRDARSSGSSR
jgi:monoamine oxidase